MNKSALHAILGTLIAAISLCAQPIQLSADVPFSFRIGETVMPAGKYAIVTNQGLIRLRTEERQPKAAMIMAHTESSRTRKAAALVFSRYGDDYFLSSVWGPEATSGMRVQPSRLEKELRNRTRFPTATQIAARALGR